ncbi:hypothetical protein [Streptomyces microflavus]|uniref:Uncharacterized protein n=1 Tax=Streptomyces microflavus TaxID=1919 RepID=A0A7H8N0E1_STRMI|nr:hypothetical protein [Streptomyces microflavus]QKW47879.1 hypothetical protein HUT09_35725 [Streptomyces microflavus]
MAFDAETGRLDVVPDLPAAGTQLRWSAPKLVAAANERVRGANVPALRVLAPAPVKASPTTAAAESAPQPTAPAAPMQGADPPEGYREAIAAHRATWNATRQHTSPEFPAAAERQLRERFREPEEHFADGRQALAELRAKAADEQQVRPRDASRARALQRLATEHAGLATLMPKRPRPGLPMPSKPGAVQRHLDDADVALRRHKGLAPLAGSPSLAQRAALLELGAVSLEQRPTSARAESTLPTHPNRGCGSAHLRLRGEHRRWSNWGKPGDGSSPLARRAQDADRDAVAKGRLTSARAEVSPASVMSCG